MLDQKYKTEKLEELVDGVFSGGTPNTKNDDYWGGQIPWLSSGETRNRFIQEAEKTITQLGADNSSTKKAEKGDIIIASAGQGQTRGQTSYLLFDSYINQSLIAIRANKSLVHPLWLFYNLSNRYEEFRQLSDSHSSRGSLTTGLLKTLKVTYPDYNEQTCIADTLYYLDQKIKLNASINALLEDIVKTIYDYWFIQYDFPTELGKPYKSSGGNIVHNPVLKREIPEMGGWHVSRIGDVLKSVLGGTPSTTNQEYWHAADIPWLNSGEITEFPILQSEEKITQQGIENSAAELLPKGSVLVSLVRHIRVSILAVNAAFNQSVVGIHENKKLQSSFIYPYLTREVPRLMTLRTGAQQPHINKSVIENSLILIPPESTLEKYYEIANPIFEKISSTAEESLQLIKIRNWLLPMLMNGQVKVL